MAVRSSAVGYDPIQRSEQWKRRIGREEVVVCNGVAAGGLPVDRRSEVLRLTLQDYGIGQAPGRSGMLSSLGRNNYGPGGGTTRSKASSARGGTGYSGSGFDDGVFSGFSARSAGGNTNRLTPRHAGKDDLLTPRSGGGQTPLSTRSGLSKGSVVASSAFGSDAGGTANSLGSAASSVLRAKLSEETKRRLEVESQLKNLQSILNSTPSVSDRQSLPSSTGTSAYEY